MCYNRLFQVMNLMANAGFGHNRQVGQNRKVCFCCPLLPLSVDGVVKSGVTLKMETQQPNHLRPMPPNSRPRRISTMEQKSTAKSAKGERSFYFLRGLVISSILAGLWRLHRFRCQTVRNTLASPLPTPFMIFYYHCPSPLAVPFLSSF
jgi:hypothetical protein